MIEIEIEEGVETNGEIKKGGKRKRKRKKEK